jgi:3-hydroxybutyryl-CoA dehydratase
MSAVAPVARTIDQPRIDAYADASADHNPIHVDAAFAAGTPFGGTIAHGMLVLALLGEMMHAAHGEAWRRSGRLKVRFKAPTRPGDTVTASATSSKSSDGAIEYAVQCANQRGEILIEGRASVTEDGRPRPSSA